MTFKLGSRSVDRLRDVDQRLINCIILALTHSKIDFTVIQGLRTELEQRQNIASGASQTMKSKHLTGEAVDLGAWIDNTLSYEEHWYYDIAEAMQKASRDLYIPIIWGGCWKRLDHINDVIEAVQIYKKERHDLGKKPFFDFGHFELDG